MFVAGVVFIALAPAGTDAQAHTTSTLVRPATPAASLAVTGTRQLVTSVNQLVARSPMSLTAAVEPLVQESGGSVGITLVELGGSSPLVWAENGSAVFTAASTYKLAALIMEAQNIASGAADPNGLVCYTADDYEDGWFDDYTDGTCFTRSELALRAGLYSDNTAGHMLVRDLGGADALNAWAASAGASSSAFFVANTTSAADLAALWVAEAKGSLGGAAAQAWLYPVLTGTATEAGVPAGVGGRSAVVHKTGAIDQVVNDAALVVAGPKGAYVLTVMTDGIGGDAAWQLIAAISSDVWSFEAARA
ncbi:MAG TPA: serine hydrolase [Candidatus Limnocylindrales bacterium]|nr:serine hydrolase [Candidatus Limnocylindrales bacterium]